MNKKIAFIATILCISSTSALAADLKDVAPYPAAEKDQVRHAIFLPVMENEDNLKVEISMGKTMEVDCNRHMLGGTFESKDLQGWGYNYFVLSEVTGPAATMMACLDDKKHSEFVTVSSATLIERYNSKLPIVVYTPKDIQVRYRIWTTTDDFHNAEVK